MWALEQSWIPRRGAVFAGTPLPVIAALAALTVTVGGLSILGRVPREVFGIAGLAATQGSLLVVALAWGAADSGVRLPWWTVPLTIALLAAGATAATLDARGALALLAVPAWLAVLARNGRLAGLGLIPAIPLLPATIGALIGVVLGAHLLYSASQTLGHPLRSGGWTPVLVLWAYDLGANVIAAECFFRGALFNRLQRRWSFGLAASAATALSLARYLVDPLLPGQIEVMVGALFYLTILGLVNCWLLWWSGHLVPGLLAAAIFFLAYRMLAIG